MESTSYSLDDIRRHHTEAANAAWGSGPGPALLPLDAPFQVCDPAGSTDPVLAMEADDYHGWMKDPRGEPSGEKAAAVLAQWFPFVHDLLRDNPGLVAAGGAVARALLRSCFPEDYKPGRRYADNICDRLKELVNTGRVDRSTWTSSLWPRPPTRR